jgi:murein DD-endopeptidase MepM/ murein hydrolase activator NlpD
LIVIWSVTISTREFQELGLSAEGIYTANEIYKIGGSNLVKLYYWFSNIQIPQSINVYFLSLGAIFFQYNLLAGIIISIGLLMYSRIAFSLSIIGFFFAYIFYIIIGADISTLSYSYIGFNFILTAIALGGFFLIPSSLSYLWVVVLLPIIVIITFSANFIFDFYQLSILSLPFNIVVIIFLYVLKLRTTFNKHLAEVLVQYNSPEKNLYYFKNSKERFKELQYMSLSLPFWGEWNISQGHNGDYTHKGEWKHAWDFIIRGVGGRQYKNSGNNVSDYHCYDKAVLAPADGVVQEIIDGVEDNEIGDINTNQNWGNSIVIRHTNYLYTKLSHLKKGSFKVFVGSSVKKGDILASCGSSGHSPYPHLHFQVQTTPYVGSKTLEYPISHYITKSGKEIKFNSYKIPKEEEVVSNVETNEILKESMHFIPGQKIGFEVKTSKSQQYRTLWEVKIDAYNNTYIHCLKTNSFAYFYNDGDLHYFRDFIGDKESLLYYFFLAFFKIPMVFFINLKTKDNVPVNKVFKKKILFFQDFVAPFTMFLKSEYKMRFVGIDDELSPTSIDIKSEINNYIFNNKKSSYEFNISIGRLGVRNIEVKKGREIVLQAKQTKNIKQSKIEL